MIFCRYKHTLLQSISVRSSTTRGERKREREREKKRLLMIRAFFYRYDQTIQLDEKEEKKKQNRQDECMLNVTPYVLFTNTIFYLTKTSIK